MSESFGFVHRRSGLLLAFFCIYLLLSWQLGRYIVGWQPRMTAAEQMNIGLCEQGAEECFKALLSEAKCFPVQERLEQKGISKWILGKNGGGRAAVDGALWYFEDGYGDGRSYGGNRKHEGIDIMSADGERGGLQIQSVTKGIVEQLGWLELGGYRVGIRSPSGLYYYYAHMDSYAPGLKKGDTVYPGTLLGYMGDTGYGEEGTRGEFPVHLHFGIYYDLNGDEKSLNPYYLLRVLEEM